MRSASRSPSSNSSTCSNDGGSWATKAPFCSRGICSTMFASRAKSSTLLSSVARGMPANGFWILWRAYQHSLPVAKIARSTGRSILPRCDVAVQAHGLLPTPRARNIFVLLGATILSVNCQSIGFEDSYSNLLLSRSVFSGSIVRDRD